MIGTRTPETALANRFPATVRLKNTWHSISCGSYKINHLKPFCAGECCYLSHSTLGTPKAL